MNDSILDRAIEVLEQVTINKEPDSFNPEDTHCGMGKQMQCPCDNPVCTSSE
ncbi:MAG: hypothetical protein P9L94_05875 [Candidatus Hinthialibacter antarcticus]|nr:hypothetical protein [Candidatus Hinthialibacter antarcticus]